MATLTDRAFLEDAAAASASAGSGAPARAGRFPQAAMVAALAGVGDKRLRAAQDFLLGAQGYGDVAEFAEGWHPVAGEAVQYALPQDAEGLCRVGRIREVQGQHAIVEVGDHAYDVVPLSRLSALSEATRGETQRASIQAALGGFGQGSGLERTMFGSGLSATRDLAPMAGYEDAYSWTLSYTAGRKPSTEEVRHYVQAHYPGAQVADGDDSFPGRIALILTFAQMGMGAIPGSPAQQPGMGGTAPGLATEERPGELVDPMMGMGAHAGPDGGDALGDPGADGGPGPAAPGGPSLGGAGPGFGGAGAEATGVGGYGLVAAWLEHVAQLNPGYDFVAGSTSEEADGTTRLAFHLRQGGRSLFVHTRNAQVALRPVLAAHAPEASGFVTWSPGHTRPSILVAGMPAGAVGLRTAAALPYSTGQGPQSIHENELGANDSGSYVVQAEEDGEHRETIGGPGLALAHGPKTPASGPAADYYESYYSQGPTGTDYGHQLTRDIDASASLAETRLASVYEAWSDAQRRPPTRLELAGVLDVLATAPGREVLGQMTEGLGASPAKGEDFDVVESLLRARWMDAEGANAVDRFVTNYLAKNPERLEQLGIYRNILQDALQHGDPKQVQRIIQQYAPEQAMFAQEPPPEPYAQPAGPEPVAQPPGQLEDPNSDYWRSFQPSHRQEPEELPPMRPRREEPASGMRGLWDRLRGRKPKRPRPTTAPGGAGMSGPTDMGELPDAQMHGPTARRAPARTAAERAPGRRRLPTANEFRFRMTHLTRRGDYLAATVVWDPEATTGMAPSSVVLAIREYVKRRSTEKENIDLGFIGRVVLEMCDLEAGMAEVRFRSSESRVGPQEVVTRDEGDYHELA